MASIRITLRNNTKKRLESLLQSAKEKGDLATIKKILSIFAVVDGCFYQTISEVLRVSLESIRLWVKDLILYGPESVISKKSPGRPSKLTKTQRKELERIIIEGPEAAGFPGACWRSPMIQNLIYIKFGALYSVHYIAQLLKNMGFSYQKAKFTADDKDPEKRKEWLQTVWPQIIKLAREKNAHILFGDEASFPQWGTLSYTWAKRGQQPVVKTSGIRRGYKVFGLIDYFTGKFFYECNDKKLNSDTYQMFIDEVMKKTRKHIILIQDGASYHTSVATRKYFEEHAEKITVFNLPSYSPDYNPIEMLWKKVKEKYIHLHYFPTFESLKEKVNEALLGFTNLKEEILALFGLYDNLHTV